MTANTAIVILTRNAKNLILSCLKNLVSKSSVNFKIIVVDNGSKDKTVDEVAKNFPEVIIIENKNNYGFAKGINYGIKLAVAQGYDWILILNDDTVVKIDDIYKLIEEANEKNYLVSGPLILSPDNKVWSAGGIINKEHFSGGLIGYGRDKWGGREKGVDFISGTAMLVKSQVFQKIGYFDEDYFLYYDDVDYCYRAKNKGIASYIIPKVKITHLETITIGKNSPSHYYHAAKSHLIFVFKRAPLFIKLREFIYTFKRIYSLFISKNETKKKYELLAITDFFLLNWGQKSRIKPI